MEFEIRNGALLLEALFVMLLEVMNPVSGALAVRAAAGFAPDIAGPDAGTGSAAVELDCAASPGTALSGVEWATLELLDLGSAACFAFASSVSVADLSLTDECSVVGIEAGSDPEVATKTAGGEMLKVGSVDRTGFGLRADEPMAAAIGKTGIGESSVVGNARANAAAVSEALTVDAGKTGTGEVGNIICAVEVCIETSEKKFAELDAF